MTGCESCSPQGQREIHHFVEPSSVNTVCLHMISFCLNLFGIRVSLYCIYQTWTRRVNKSLITLEAQ